MTVHAVWTGLAASAVFATAAATAGAGSGAGPTAPAMPATLGHAGPDAVATVLLPTASPLVNFRFVFHTGSMDDPSGRLGLTYLAATTIAEGGTAALTYSEVLDRLFPWAADLYVQVDKEQVTFIGRCHRDHLEEFYPLLRDVLTAPRFDAKDFTRVRDKALNDLTKDLRTSDEENLGKAALEWASYAGHKYRHPVLGSATGLRAATLADARAQAARVFTVDRLTVGLAGAVDAALETRIKSDFAAALPWHGTPVAAVAHAAMPAGRRVLVVDKPDARSTAISIGFPLATTRTHPDFAALALMASYFGEHRQFHGVLFRSLREARGLNYGDYAYVETFIQEGWDRFPRANVGRRDQLFSMWLRPVQPDKAMFALRGALWNLERLVKKGVTPEDFDRTRSFLMGYSYLMEQTDMRRLGYKLDDVFYGLSAPHHDRLRAAWAKMTAGDVNAAIKKHIGYTNLTIAVVTPGGAAFKDALVKGAASPIKYEAPPDSFVLDEDKEIVVYPLGLTTDRITVVPVDKMFE